MDIFGAKGPIIQTIKENILYWQVENPGKNQNDLLAEIKENKDKFTVDRFGF